MLWSVSTVFQFSITGTFDTHSMFLSASTYVHIKLPVKSLIHFCSFFTVWDFYALDLLFSSMKFSFIINTITVENSVDISSYSRIDFLQKIIPKQVQNELFMMICLCFVRVLHSIHAPNQVASTH